MTFLLTKAIHFYYLAIYSQFYSRKVLVVLFLQNSFILVLGKANVKCAQSCIGGQQNLREYLFCLQLLIGFDTLIYRRRLQMTPYSCGLSETLYHEDHGATLKHKCGKMIVALPLLSFLSFFYFYLGLLSFFCVFFAWSLIPTCGGIIVSIILSSHGTML